MNQQLIHTPEGVRDIYGMEYAKKLSLQEILHTTIKTYGFLDIQTPTFEFFDVFSKEMGTTPSKELYKFFDKEGETLVLRPDFTPSMARCAAKYFSKEKLPIRLCYEGNTFTNTSELQGKLKEVTQIGAELIGDASPKADAEIICMVIDSLCHAGLTDFQVSIGHVDFFRGLCEDAGIQEETEIALREYISNKNYFAAQDVLQQNEIASDKKEIILKVTDLFGGVEILTQADQFVSNSRSKSAISWLQEVYSIVCLYGKEKYLSFDLGMLSKYRYYSGIILKAYTYGIGDAIVTGGRYDHLLERFGKQAPAIGFMIVLDDLIAALGRQKIEIPLKESRVLIVYERTYFKIALEEAKTLRTKGVFCELLELPSSEEAKRIASEHMCDQILTIIDENNKNLEKQVGGENEWIQSAI